MSEDKGKCFLIGSQFRRIQGGKEDCIEDCMVVLWEWDEERERENEVEVEEVSRLPFWAASHDTLDYHSSMDLAVSLTAVWLICSWSIDCLSVVKACASMSCSPGHGPNLLLVASSRSAVVCSSVHPPHSHTLNMARKALKNLHDYIQDYGPYLRSSPLIYSRSSSSRTRIGRYCNFGYTKTACCSLSIMATFSLGSN